MSTGIEWCDETFTGGRYRLADRHGATMAEWPEDLKIRELPEVRL